MAARKQAAPESTTWTKNDDELLFSLQDRRNKFMSEQHAKICETVGSNAYIADAGLTEEQVAAVAEFFADQPGVVAELVQPYLSIM